MSKISSNPYRSIFGPKPYDPTPVQSPGVIEFL